MIKIPYPLKSKILQPLIDSDHEVMLPLQHIISAWLENKELDSMLALIKSWVDDLQEMYDKAEKVDDLENNLYRIDGLIDDAENSLDEIRGYTNV
jgi:hypothetical protein|tara:strand:+ start:243 stop:527 length:285 start_codon:yes stop_codon:yes gene_type:complete